MVAPPLCIVIQVRLDLQPDRSEAAKPRRDCAGWAALDNTKRATRRQEDGVADDAAYHVVAHHVASHGLAMRQHKVEAAEATKGLRGLGSAQQQARDAPSGGWRR